MVRNIFACYFFSFGARVAAFCVAAVLKPRRGGEGKIKNSLPRGELRLEPFDYGRSHLVGGDRLLAEGYISRANAGAYGVSDSSLDFLGGGVAPERVAQHQGGGENLRARVGYFLSGDVWCCTAGGFVQTEFVSERIFRHSQRRAAKHSQRPANNRHFVRQNVAEHIFRKENVKLVGIAGKFYIEFTKGDTDENGIYDERDDYIYKGKWISKEEWDKLTEPYLAVKPADLCWKPMRNDTP